MEAAPLEITDVSQASRLLERGVVKRRRIVRDVKPRRAAQRLAVVTRQPVRRSSRQTRSLRGSIRGLGLMAIGSRWGTRRGLLRSCRAAFQSVWRRAVGSARRRDLAARAMREEMEHPAKPPRSIPGIPS